MSDAVRSVLVMKFPYETAYGGGEQLTFQMIDGLSKLGWSFSLYSNDENLLRGFSDRDLPHQRMWAPREPVSARSALLFPLLALPFTVIGIARLIGFRMLHPRPILFCLSLTEKITLSIPARLLGYRVVWAEHLIPGRETRLNPFRPFLMLASHVAVIVTVSEAVRKRYAALGYAKRSLRVIHPGVDLSRFQMGTTWPRHRGKFQLGIVARLHKEKGHDVLLQALARLTEFIPFITLTIVGSGPALASLKWLTQKLSLTGRVHFVGFQKNIGAWMHEFDVMILPSQTPESFGIVLIEAMAAGVPVIAAGTGGVPEIITHAKNGLLLSTGSSENIVQAVLFLANTPRATDAIITSGRTTVEKRFLLEHMIAQFATLFRQLTDR